MGERETMDGNPTPKAGRSRALVAGSIWSAGVLLVMALVGLLNYFGMKYYHRFDWTGSKIYSLSEKSVSMLEGLDRDVTVSVFLQPGSELYDPTRELLERYAGHSSRVRLRFVDPQRNLIEAQRNLVELQDRQFELRAEARRRRAALDRAIGTGASPALPGEPGSDPKAGGFATP